MYKTIIPALKIPEDKGIGEAYKKIKNNFIIDRLDLESYVIILNSVLVKGVIQDLLDTSQALLEEIYSTENAGSETPTE